MFLIVVATSAAIGTGDSRVRASPAPTGEVIQGIFERSQIYPGTWREYWVYIPRQLDRTKPAPVMVFQDGIQYNAPAVFDDLIDKKEIPPLVGVFVMHGRVKAPSGEALDRMNRSVEYDSVNADYAKFLIDELLPYVSATHGLTLSTDPNDRAIAGNSSGAIAAFAAAWQRPDAFRRVFSAIGTYVGLRGGNELPVLIRKTEPKPIRVFLQDGTHDLNNYTGNWWIANQDMLSALEYAGYDVRHEWGDGEHNSRHATAIFPDVLRWLWRDWPAPVKANPAGASRQDVFETILPGEEWRLVGDTTPSGELAVNGNGDVFFADASGARILKADVRGSIMTFVADAHGARVLTFGPEGRLFASIDRPKQLVAYDPSGHATVIAAGVSPSALAVDVIGNAYFTEPAARKILHMGTGGTPRVVDEGIEEPAGVLFSPDQTLLYVTDRAGQRSWAFQVQRDGSLTHKQRYFYPHRADAARDSGADGIAVDTDGRVYIATTLGVQVFDQIGKCHAIIPAPRDIPVSHVVFGGSNLDVLFIAAGDKVFSRRTKVKGVLSWRGPIKPAPPRL